MQEEEGETETEVEKEKSKTEAEKGTNESENPEMNGDEESEFVEKCDANSAKESQASTSKGNRWRHQPSPKADK